MLLRGDSGFAVPNLYKLCEKESVYNIIRLKSNARLQALAEKLHLASEIKGVTEAKATCSRFLTDIALQSPSHPAKKSTTLKKYHDNLEILIGCE